MRGFGPNVAAERALFEWSLMLVTWWQPVVSGGTLDAGV
jgi:hypothetical protein